jgi:mono/diheme cytochrome c family protein
VFRVAAFTAALGGLVLVANLHAQAPAPPSDVDTKIWSGVYSSAQAERGRGVYEAYCTRCHGLGMAGGRDGAGGGPALAGDNFWLDWERSTLANLFSKISKTMPNDSPGSLRADDYSDVLAYILQGNKFPVGTVEIAPTGAGLDAVRIARMAGAEVEAPNFALVQVVGCLTPGADNQWTLTRTTRPQVTREELPPAAALKDAETRQLGDGTLRLFSVAAFQSTVRPGQRVEARGLLNRVSSETRLDLLSLKVVSASCGT